ncbi:hypothetical protein OC845_006399 [Tilletia horrida]|nr:hypothetical protein OC845_006399 [Tilletia horrida]
MGSTTSRPLDSQVDCFILQCAEWYERFLRWSSNLLILFFIPLISTPVTITNYCSRARRRWANSSSSSANPANSSVVQEKFPLTRTTSMCTCHHQQQRQHLQRSRRIQELQVESHHDLKRVTSITSQRSTSTTTTSATPASPYSLAGIKASRQTIERRRARAERAAAGFDLHQLPIKTSAAHTPSNAGTPTSTTPPELPLPAPAALKRRTSERKAYDGKKKTAAALAHQRSSLPMRAKDKADAETPPHQAFVLTPGAQQPHLRLAPALVPSASPKVHKERKHHHGGHHPEQQHDQPAPLPETPVRRASSRRRARAQGSYQGL